MCQQLFITLTDHYTLQVPKAWFSNYRGVGDGRSGPNKRASWNDVELCTLNSHLVTVPNCSQAWPNFPVQVCGSLSWSYSINTSWIGSWAFVFQRNIERNHIWKAAERSGATCRNEHFSIVVLHYCQWPLSEMMYRVAYDVFDVNILDTFKPTFKEHLNWSRNDGMIFIPNFWSQDLRV